MTDSSPLHDPSHPISSIEPEYPAVNGGHSTSGIRSGGGDHFESIGSKPLTTNMKDTMSKGPVAENAKQQYTATTSEFQNLTDKAHGTGGQKLDDPQLTQFHSLFYSLLSWENPRATAIVFLSAVLFIFAGRYLNIIRYVFKALYLTLGVTASAEVAGKLLFSNGFTSQIRPRVYYRIPKDTLELILDDVQELINFFVIEFQRLLFAENVVHTIGAFLASIVSYLLIKFVPFWGLTLIGTSVLFLAPLIYVNNKQVIDTQLSNVSEIMSKQAAQVKGIAGEHTSRATESVKSYAGEYTSKAQQYIGSARARTGSPLDTAGSATTSSSSKLPGTTTTTPAHQFPSAPKQDPSPLAKQEPLVTL